MPKKIYNEGRVVGLSAYEIYVKQHLAEDPDTPPATEREWLASSLAMGSSMLLKLKGGSSYSPSSSYCISDIEFPNDSNLAAANTIIASFFIGEAEWDSESPSMDNYEWATNITSVSPLFDKSRMYEDVEDYPQSQLLVNQLVDFRSIAEGLSDNYKKRLKNYMKILDGVVLQPGVYYKNEPKLDPKLSGSNSFPIIRLWLTDGDIEAGEEPYILLTGFTSKSVLSGITKVEGSDKPEDGDFLGPGAYPWINKIVFSIPNSYFTEVSSSYYDRTIQDSRQWSGYPFGNAVVKDSPVIDMRSYSPYANPDSHQYGLSPVLETYYSTSTPFDNTLYAGTNRAEYLVSKQESRVPVDVNKYNSVESGASVLTVYQTWDSMPPALFGTFVDSTGTHYLHPIDSVAPGSVKVFNNNAAASTLKSYELNFPGTVAMKRDSSGNLYTINSSGAIVPVASTHIKNIKGGKGISVSNSNGVYTISSTIDDPSLYVQGYSSNLANWWSKQNPTISYSEVTYNTTRSFEQVSSPVNQGKIVVNLKYVVSEDTVTVNRYSGGSTSQVQVPSSIKISFTTEVLPTESAVSWGSDGTHVLEMGITGTFGTVITHDASSLDGTFSFCHSSGPSTGNKQYANSRLFGLNFQGPLAYLNYQGSASEWLYGFPLSVNQSGLSHGVWNIVGLDGLMYDYNYAIWDDKITGAMDHNSRLVVCAMNCGDGYNTRIERDPSVTSQLTNLRCTYMNFAAELTLYVKNKFKV